MLLYLDELLAPPSKPGAARHHNSSLPLSPEYNGHYPLQNRGVGNIGSDGDVDGITIGSDADTEGITIGSDHSDEQAEESARIPYGYLTRNNKLPISTSYDECLPTLNEDNFGESRESLVTNGSVKRKYNKQTLIPRLISTNTSMRGKERYNENEELHMTSLDFEPRESSRKESVGSYNSDSSGVYSSTHKNASRHTSISSNESYSVTATLKTSIVTPNNTQQTTHPCGVAKTSQPLARSNSVKESTTSTRLPQVNGHGTKPANKSRDFIQDNKNACKTKGLSRSLSLRCRPVSKPVRLTRSNSQRVISKEGQPQNAAKTSTSSIPVPVAKPVTIKKITIKRSCSQRLSSGAKPASIVRSASQKLKSPPEHVSILRRESANHVNKREPISPHPRQQATPRKQATSLTREATDVKVKPRQQNVSRDESDSPNTSSESSSYFSASDYNIEEGFDEEEKTSPFARLMQNKDAKYTIEEDFTPPTQSETYNAMKEYKPLNTSLTNDISILASSSSTTNHNLSEQLSPTCTEESKGHTSFEKTCKDYMLPYVDLYSGKSCQGYIGSLSITSDYRLPGIKAIKIHHQPQSEGGIELDIDSNGKNIIEGLMQSTISAIVDKSINKKDASTSPDTGTTASGDKEIEKEIDRLTKHNEDLIKELEEVYTAFEEEREKRLATDKVLEVLKVALEESEREVKKIPLMISYSEKRISLLEEVLAEYKHEVYMNGSCSSRHPHDSNIEQTKETEMEEDSILDLQI